uniref:Solute carrier family 19 member 1 n=1 Tax=Eptatretus burgeri TaxID=7764 RepID=A0A8C4WT60_EPTBU
MPVLAYSFLVLLIPAFLLSDLLRYKPILMIQCASFVAIWLLAILGQSLLAIQFLEFFYGLTMAARIAYSSFLFSLVDAQHYQRIASLSRFAVLLGLFTSSCLGQTCVTLGVSYLVLCYISLGFTSFTALLSCFLPWPKRSMFFNKNSKRQTQAPCDDSTVDGVAPANQRPEGHSRGPINDLVQWSKANCSASSLTTTTTTYHSSNEDCVCKSDPGHHPRRSAGSLLHGFYVTMLADLGKALKTSKSLEIWSFWWIFGTTGYYMVIYYLQLLWDTIASSRDDPRVYNGAAEALSTLFGAFGAGSVGFLQVQWSKWGVFTIALGMLLQSLMLFMMNCTSSIWLCYTGYVVFRTIHQSLFTIATFEIAKTLTRECTALVFGVNTFIATVAQTVVTLILIDKRGLALSVHIQFYVYATYFMVLVVFFLGLAWYFHGARGLPSAADGDQLSNCDFRTNPEAPAEDGNILLCSRNGVVGATKLPQSQEAETKTINEKPCNQDSDLCLSSSEDIMVDTPSEC